MTNKISIEVLGSKITISSYESEEYVLGLVSDINSNLKELLSDDNKVSINSALILCCLDYADTAKKSELSADNLRGQIREYLDEANRLRDELEALKRELHRARR